MSQFRKNLVTKVFKILDKKGSNVIPEDELKELYVGARHPDVLIRKKTEEEVWTEFLDTFEEYCYFIVFLKPATLKL